MANKHITTDIVIAGGGVTGLALAALLLKFSKLRVAIVEAREPLTSESNSGQEFDARSVALSAYSCEILTAMGVAINEIGCPIQQIHVSDKGHLGQCTLDARDYAIDKLGSVVELSSLQAMLTDKLNQQVTGSGTTDKHSQLEWLCPDQIVSLKQHSDSIDVELNSGSKITGKLLVVAEGANSHTSKLLGIESTRQDYEQAAVVANIELKESHNFKAFERFTDTGPLALLPMPATRGIDQQKQCSLVWTVKPSQAEELLALNNPDFLNHVQKIFGNRLGKFVGVSDRSSFPLALIRAQSCTAHRAVLLGNASQMLHPIAGQGLNLALRDVANLVNVLKTAPADVGRYALLREYATSRQQDHQLLILATDALVRTFSNNYFPLIIGRNLGLSLLDHLSMFKTQLATAAMGFNRRVVLNSKKAP